MDSSGELWRCLTRPNPSTIIGLFLFVLLISVPNTVAGPMRAQAIMMTNSQYGVSQRLGVVIFTQEEYGGPVHVTSELTFNTVTEDTQVGIHIHAYGNMTKGCDSTGPHFNPDGQRHGGPTDAIRHVGDLGNVQIVNKLCSIDITDKNIQLAGPHSIVGRAVVIHMRADDMGKGGNEESLLTGNVGPARACGIIGVASDFSLSPPSINTPSANAASSFIHAPFKIALITVSLVFSFVRCMGGGGW